MKALIFHGTLGSPEGNWFPWLKSTLEKKGWDISVPRLPTPDQSPEKWKQALEKQVETPKDTDIIIAHSSGVTFTLHLLEEGFIRPKKVIFISGLIDNIGNEEYDALNAPFIDKEFNWETIQKNCHEIIILHGDNDPYVPTEQAEKIAKNLNIPLQIIKNGGHLNTEAGYTEFPEILEYLNDT